MSRCFAVEATIDKPAAEVWDALTDWSNAHRWMSGIEAMKADGATAPGTTLTFYARGKEREAEIARCKPGRQLVLRSVQGSVSADYEYEIHPLSKTTSKVTLVADCQTRGVLTKALSPLLRLAVRLTDGKQLQALKNVIEAS